MGKIKPNQMNELVKCKVRDIKDSSDRWEIRLEGQILPPVIEKLAGHPIKLKFDAEEYGAYTGIAAKDKPSQYFWINTHKDDAGPIGDILKAHGYKPNDQIVLSIDEVNRVVSVRQGIRMATQPRLNDPHTARLHNVIDMGLGFSAMIRLFDRGSKGKLRARVLSEIHTVFEVESEKRFNEIHANFCNWGTHNIMLAERRKSGRIVKKAGPASYGQIAKTLDVVLKVAIYYCHLPSCEKSHLISRWLNAAVDTKMMALLRRYYPEDIRPWPTTIEQVNRSAYTAIQETVRKFITERHSGSITPVQFDDIYWEALNRQRASSVE